MESIKLTAPFDAHIHWRILETLMKEVSVYSRLQFAGGLLMPNTGAQGVSSNIFSKKDIDWYKGQVKTVNTNSNFFTLLTYFLSPSLKEEDLTVAEDYKGIVTPFHGQKIPWSVDYYYS